MGKALADREYLEVEERGLKERYYRVGDQDSASAPTAHPHSPCPYIWGTWYLVGGRIVWLMRKDE